MSDFNYADAKPAGYWSESHSFIKAKELNKLLAPHMPQIVDSVLGARFSGRDKSNGGEMRWRANSSFVLYFGGDKPGRWADFCNDGCSGNSDAMSGDAIQFIIEYVLKGHRKNDEDFRKACEWARDYLGSDGGFHTTKTVTRGYAETCVDEAAQTPSQEERKNRNKAIAERIWNEGRPIGGTQAEEYLKGRGIAHVNFESLRFHVGLWNSETNGHLPCLLSKISGVNGDFRAIQRTFLEIWSATKANVKDPKKTLGSQLGGGVWFGRIGERLLVGEGVESTLSAHVATGLPAVATLGTSGMQNLELPTLPWAKEVVILADNDRSGAGLNAAKRLAARLVEEGRLVRIAMPSVPAPQ